MSHVYQRIINRLKIIRRNALQKLGVSWYSQPAFDGIDRKLEKYLPKKGIFIEAGAYDGISESNTYYLEKIKGWKGILVEPVIGNYRACLKNRSASNVFNCALVASHYLKKNITLQYGGLMSFATDVYSDEQACQKRVDILRRYHDDAHEFEIEARTLTSILDESSYAEIDFLSLDVEGYELEVLKGLDFEKYKPNFMLIECRDHESRVNLESLIREDYTFLEQLSKRDFLYKRV